ncbi:MAG: hypothetical protein EZS28_024458, partial [Streblomastix strix]
ILADAAQMKKKAIWTLGLRMNDPYVVLQLQGNRKNKTTDKKESLNPVWNESFTLEFDPEISDEREIIAEIYDYDRFNKNDMIGSVKIPVRLNIKKLSNSRMPPKAGNLYVSVLYDEVEKIEEEKDRKAKPKILEKSKKEEKEIEQDKILDINNNDT